MRLTGLAASCLFGHLVAASGCGGDPRGPAERAEPPVDRGLLADVLARIAALAQAFPEIAELDVNPFLAAPEGERSCALDVRIRVAG